MNTALAFKFVFLSQIVVLSYILPGAMTTSRKGNTRFDNDATNSDDVKDKHRSYLLLNRAVILIGLGLLALLSVHPIFASTTWTLLAIGAFFILQMIPLVLLLIRSNSHPTADMNESTESLRDTISLFDAVHPLPVGIACLLFVAYLATGLISWNGGWDSHLKQVVVFVATNLFLACIVGVQLYAIRNVTNEQRVDHISNFRKTAPLVAYVSIVISIYYFSKTLLSNFELHEYRPIMMSGFLQLIASLAFYQLTRANAQESHANE